MADQVIRTVDLFAGAGGLSQGFAMSGRGYEPVFAVEVDPAAARTFKRNFGCDVYSGPIEMVTEYPEADVIIGGPPCQGFSPLGRDRDDESRSQLNELWRHYLTAVREIRPKVFVIENVPEFQRSAQFARLLELMDTDPVLRDYAHGHGVLHAADHGVPQSRRRGIFIAVRDVDEVPWPPPATHGPDTRQAYRTVRDAIADLPVTPIREEIGWDGDQQDLHLKRNPRPTSLERYRAIPEGGNRFDLARNRPDLLPRCWAEKPTGTTDVMGRLWWDRPSVTIRTEFYKPEKGRYLHPEADRPITHREAARLQSFPDDFVFEGTKIEVARQIGNAVPALLGRAIAEHVHDIAFEP
ncbi:DNA cytosine methyltransferase [Phytomonospora endophytica]|uniref:Cytosine-specific methyltransferase n=1 Tax=Phytomonospora endophytica TaxID=714109 RepID=A0A841FJX8_9ACTN|nr:DNA cytosine methyltransferase [Phytomonospora endophytica]MBB6036184.1 DNA (cytosine-5)-methyltransferase 1 [Phytomonospora endophytica]GIG67090.1 cytosine-specific methyltransferase [Phytomonospora endophytica]